ncbi:MAG: D-alanyl-D-alanine carboxypeptidase [Candidatus Liberibacter ctenarytainae]|uniref:D-alanyl-D-alanine carboxypeptidase n=1 Tax=Candidatus Liberibacter ctenarytainae TaxID=2020335 RepID=A0A937AJI0_9HYPH|nr:D-alanyl-D-alanine carboxypeptidase [Candidatus Liberibacter ctenarytainae]
MSQKNAQSWEKIHMTYESIRIHKGIKALWKIFIAFNIAIIGMESQSYAQTKYASIVIDVRTNKTINQFQQDSKRYPASLAKMMTLYIIFENLKAKKIDLTTKIPVSKTSTMQPPSKLYLRENIHFTTEQGILALITRSANDVSTAFAEFLSGSEKQFAKVMSDKAKELKMNNTVYKNASGLHHIGQVTTARDQATLGILLRKNFPQYYKYFSVRQFRYKNRIITNHNKLLGPAHNIDGIKTGYTQESGFNIATSVKTPDISLLAIIMGMPTHQARDQKTLKLIALFHKQNNRKRSQKHKKNHKKIVSKKSPSITKPSQTPLLEPSLKQYLPPKPLFIDYKNQTIITACTKKI